MARIGIYGGTFNPPHRGHVLAARAFAEGLLLDRVLLIPGSVPPHKTLPVGSPDPETRLRLCALAVRDLPFAEVSDMELHREGKSYTAETVEKLRREYPGDELYLLMGTDMFLSFDRWRDPERICACVELAMAFRREPDPEEREAVLRQKAMLERKFSARVTLLQNEIYDVSSSSVRRLLCLGAGETEVPEAVYGEILRLGLYRAGGDLKNLPFEALRSASLSLHKPSRVAHAEGCCQMARRLAARYGESVEDAARAGILHDVTKALYGREQLLLCAKYAIILDQFSAKNEKLLHAITGAAAAERIFGENEKICGAIRWHTTGRAGMTTLEKIVYLADLVELGRVFPGVTTLRAAAMEDLDRAMQMALRRTVAYVEGRGDLLHPDSLAALRWEEQNRQSLPESDKKTEVNQ
ncbi:MAG: nicotinate (nicotinamide) nucleotide adenylyltransferase [Oscillospiraceae bacterium]|nr:nicotinate (nicotinamide) nucleotide adenylyltransferase [Oscillospiraceae bacterium]